VLCFGGNARERKAQALLGFPMRGRGEVRNEEWAVLEPLLRLRQRVDGRGRPPQDQRTVRIAYCGFGARGTVAGKGASSDDTSDVGVSNGCLPGCNGSGDWSRAMSIASRTFSAWSASAA
jgi:hypothetical protein